MSRHLPAVSSALVFESALGIVALLIAFLLGWPLPFEAAPASERSVTVQLAFGAIAAVPMIGALLIFERYPSGLLSELSRDATRLAVGLFRGATVVQLLLVSAAAGVGEELLFRGLLIGSLSRGTEVGPFTALLLSSALFGLAHPISRSYTVAAGVIGIYLGALYLWSGGVLAPIVTHGLYDFVALWHLLRQAGRSEETADREGLGEAEAASREGPEEERPE